MKRFLVVCLFVCVLQLGCSTQRERLSEKEIEELRVIYPIEDLCGNPLYEVREIKLEEGANKAKDWVRVKCNKVLDDVVTNGKSGIIAQDSNIAAMEEKQNIELSLMITYHVYEMVVLDSVFQVFEEGQTFLLAISDSYWDVLPDFAGENEYLVGIIPSSVPAMQDYYTTIGDTMFYLTPDDYILSVTETQPQNRMSGMRYEVMKEQLLSLKKEK